MHPFGSIPAKLFNFFLAFLLISPLSPPFIKQSFQNQNLSPVTTVKTGFNESDRLFLLNNIQNQADAVRGSTNINIFQGYDVRGNALGRWIENKKEGTREWVEPNLLPTDAFLITEAITFTYRQQISDNRQPRILITGDHRETSQVLITAAAAGAATQGFRVHFDSGHVPTGALNFYGLRENYDVIIQVTGSHNPYYANGMKIAIRQDKDGFFSPNGRLGALYGNRGKRPFELISIAKMISEQADEIKYARSNGTITDIHGSALNVKGSALEKQFNAPRFGKIVQEYVNALKERFSKLKTSRKLVVDPGNGMGAAAIPVLEHQGNEIVKGLFLEVKSRPDHPADPSKDTSGTAAYSESGCRSCIEAINEINANLSKDELPAIGILTDGDGDRSGMIDEDGKAIRPPAIATLIYRRFILENREVLEELDKLGKPIQLALDVRSSNVMETITGVVTPEGEVLKKGLYKGVQGIYISAGYPSHRDHVANEIKKLNAFKKELYSTERGREMFPNPLDLAAFTNKIDRLIQSYVSAEASGHYFAATDSTHPETMIDDGIFYAARVLEILDTWNDFEAKDENIKLPKKEVYLLKDIFSPESIPVLPSPDEPRYKGHSTVDERYAFVAARQAELLQDKERALGDANKIFRGTIASVITMDQVTDGVRINFADNSAFLIRTSNTSEKFTGMVEAETWKRVIEILEDALAWLKPHEGKSFSIDILEQRLKTAKAKAAFEKTTEAIVGKGGITEEGKAEIAKEGRLAEFHASLAQAAQDEKRMMGWLQADEQDLDQVKQVASDLRENFDDVIVIGIGGSSMGAKALHQALNKDTEYDPYNQRPQATRGRDGQKAPRLHILESTRTEALQLLDRLDLRKTAVVVISKSGGTPEPKFNTEVVLSKFEKAGITGTELASQFVLVTGLDLKESKPVSKLRQRFWNNDTDKDTARAIFPVPNSFGGRFSVFSPVGLLPAAIVGIDVDKIISGVSEARSNTELAYSDPKNIGFQLGLTLFMLDFLKEKDNFYFYYFSKALVGLGRWTEQLVQESLGDFFYDETGFVVRTGPNIKPTLGTEDNHSFVQDLQDGKRNKAVLFIEEVVSQAQIQQERSDGLYDGQGLTPSQFLKASLVGTRNSVTEKGTPNITLKLEGLNEKELAKLMYYMEVMTLVYGHLLGLGHKTFTQGGVEGYKIGTRKAIEEMVARGEVYLPEISL